MADDLDERRLVERIIAGEDPFKIFVDRYGPVVVRVLRRFRINREDRDDCWQIVFEKLLGERLCAAQGVAQGMA